MPLNYPLIFKPTFRDYIWGGRRLGTVLGKPIPETGDFAESWEVVDHGEDQSVVANGPLAGKTLGELVAEFPTDLFGNKSAGKTFPLLFKFLDANRDLSIQVHPDDAQGAKLDPPDLGKTEAWYILDAEPGSKVYVGLKEGVTREQLAQAVEANTVVDTMHVIEPQVGDCLFIPAKTTHALGKGLLVAEIQQASNTTFRLFDWNRAGADGKPRALHITESLETIDFDRGPVEPQEPQPTSDADINRLVTCDKFILDRWQFEGRKSIGGNQGFHIVAVLEGKIRTSHAQLDQALGKGSTFLIPAACGSVQLNAIEPTTLLDMYLP
ncbi:type I phosphomannose isomerase catalytic subunit [Bremerella cremea]|uniref:type I phosphomannose isomerase catalytic subunit n=1 Tax=Bremerella cremea TaxID=1031537 RepID=UPI0031E9C1A4